MESSWKRSLRRIALLLVLPLLAMTCGGPRAELPLCATTVSHEPTGDLAADLVGAWHGITDEKDWHHPIAYMAAAEFGGDKGSRIWMFRSGCTGHIWYALNLKSDSYENDEEFTWNVVEGELVVDDLPPATMDIQDAEHLTVHPVEEGVEPSRGVRLIRCDLDVPEEVRGF